MVPLGACYELSEPSSVDKILDLILQLDTVHDRSLDDTSNTLCDLSCEVWTFSPSTWLSFSLRMVVKGVYFSYVLFFSLSQLT